MGSTGVPPVVSGVPDWHTCLAENDRTRDAPATPEIPGGTPGMTGGTPVLPASVRGRYFAKPCWVSQKAQSRVHGCSFAGSASLLPMPMPCLPSL